MGSASDRHACVVGTGLAGAAVAASLVRRGWRVSLLGEGVARGASALPVGMLGVHATRSPTPLSRLTEFGVPCTRAELERLVPMGQGWLPVEVDNRGHHPGRHAEALVRPGALVRAWLDEAHATGRLDLRPDVRLQGLERTASGWRLLDDRGHAAAEAQTVVLAAALGTLGLTDALGLALPLRPVQGQLSLGTLEGDPLAERPQRDEGVFVPEYRDAAQPAPWPQRLWSMGSTYRRGSTDTAVSEAAHRDNLQRLHALSAPAAAAMAEQLLLGRLQGWAGVRCASLDRLPLVGAAPAPIADASLRSGVPGLTALARLPGLYLSCGFGSRGLSLAAMAGEAVAALIDGAAMPLPPDLRDAIDPARFAWRAARRRAAG